MNCVYCGAKTKFRTFCLSCIETLGIPETKATEIKVTFKATPFGYTGKLSGNVKDKHSIYPGKK